jgi:hypothetical protein
MGWYERLGFSNKGKSQTQFGGGGWYDLVSGLTSNWPVQQLTHSDHGIEDIRSTSNIWLKPTSLFCFNVWTVVIPNLALGGGDIQESKPGTGTCFTDKVYGDKRNEYRHRVS